MQNPLFIALDFNHRGKRRQFLEHFQDEQIDVKVGMELFYREGVKVIEELKDAGHEIFLDLKLHDIPNTVNRTMRVLAEMEISMVNVHAAGGQVMMEAAIEGLEAGTRPGKERPKLIAVTQLTSTNEEMLKQQLHIEGSLESVVCSYAQLAKEAGLDGVVCSAKEVPLIQKGCGADFLTVTPGIRRHTDHHGDQIRVVTPAEARALGSWGIVVGRSLTTVNDPLHVYKEMNADWKGVALR
ncbi:MULTISPECIES: orotidine-5'-phosphate decarboxylase [Shouchella]|uniref:Orotidine 5'-phosphate decarboxylase n=3 Tax=Bacillaceae TaxID=186817 RepID=A0A060M2X3_9BACI|nr:MULTISPECIES: orotidine-5'-phosphate decarboxylase [Bacillaceae]RQW20732.1 orotidine-5'-phosphate decarboxylase [Bacillus sp. C1-1]AIC94893.1 orotidine 5'-phosphate decarboxylase [Shouchella lehensis G1]KQL58180.1 orotidine 5'-phosphate decarboxylase [Alkalicoccobacillus plakortidis]MBG9784256.1 orotidine 5'-phosphate decarboxylase [Shouchella lehensis]TES50754.1 orotidine-5'-phosphate decarboxylase [Shouchella lehensis]